MSDVLDILDMEKPQTPESSFSGDVSKKMGSKKKTKVDDKNNSFTFKKPEGMHREVYALLYADNKDGPPIIPTDVMPNISNSGGYKQIKAKLGLKKVRPWRWMPFQNPGRTDNFMLHHWRRVADEGKEYPFAKFNKTVPIVTYSDAEYQQLLQADGWTKQETDYLFSLCRRFDLRFTIIHDRWDSETYSAPRSIEDLKERYYNICNSLAKARAVTGQEVKLRVFDADHERRRKEQMIKLYNRTSEQVEEEQKLLDELRKIEMRKRERERKTQDLQKLITAADTNFQSKKSDTSGTFKHSGGPGRPGRGPGRRRMLHRVSVGSGREPTTTPGNPASILETAGIKFPEIKSSGASLRSQRMKLPAAVGQKKTKAIEQLLTELNIELRPMPTEEICLHFNELRSDMVLLYELKAALSGCEYELQTLKHQYEALQPGKSLDIPATVSTTVPMPAVSSALANEAQPNVSEMESPKKTISEIIDVGSGPGTPSRKRRAALEQGNLLKKLKKI